MKCKSGSENWYKIFIGIRQSQNITNSANWNRTPPNGIKLNVLMFGFDSLSRNAVVRKLPKTYHVLKNILKVDILEG